jgi:hypothetical protein
MRRRNLSNLDFFKYDWIALRTYCNLFYFISTSDASEHNFETIRLLLHDSFILRTICRDTIVSFLEKDIESRGKTWKRISQPSWCRLFRRFSERKAKIEYFYSLWSLQMTKSVEFTIECALCIGNIRQCWNRFDWRILFSGSVEWIGRLVGLTRRKVSGYRSEEMRKMQKKVKPRYLFRKVTPGWRNLKRNEALS